VNDSEYSKWIERMKAVRDRSLITGEGGLVENEGGQIILCMKKGGGGANIFVQYKYLPHMTPP
jgi:hypothetical protein